MSKYLVVLYAMLVASLNHSSACGSRQIEAWPAHLQPNPVTAESLNLQMTIERDLPNCLSIKVSETCGRLYVVRVYVQNNKIAVWSK